MLGCLTAWMLGSLADLLVMIAVAVMVGVTAAQKGILWAVLMDCLTAALSESNLAKMKVVPLVDRTVDELVRYAVVAMVVSLVVRMV